MINSFIIWNLFAISWVQAELLVKVSQGTLRGTIMKTKHGRNYSAFLAIPYAQPPIHDLRFSNPIAGKPWVGVRAADKDGSQCLQFSDGKIVGNEDCLYLNVYSPWLESSLSPKTKSSNQLPVMVWIHEGAFVVGNGSSVRAGAGYLLDKDIVLVTFNYRLGMFGFFTTGDSAAPGNFGLKDQVLALKWVQENIKSFGGDPKRVTIFGESAGGVSVSLHALSSASNGLFDQYIISGGSSLCPWAYQERSELKSFAKTVAVLALCPVINTGHLVSCLRERNAKRLMGMSNFFSKIARFTKLTWTPTDEPPAEGAFLTDTPANLVNKNQMKDLPFMSGQDADEGLYITDHLYSSKTLYEFVRLSHAKVVTHLAEKIFHTKDAKAFTSAVDELYFNKSLHTLTQTPYIQDFTRFTTDGFFLYPGVKMLEKVAPRMKNPIYLYLFAYRGTFSVTSKVTGDNRNLGVSHADELKFLFPALPHSFKLPQLKFTSKDQLVVDIIVDLWTSFASNGKPTSKKLSNPNLWKPYSTKDKSYLQIGRIDNNSDPTVTASNDYYSERMNFWRENTGKR